MTWLVHATRTWTDGQVAVAFFFASSGGYMAAELAVGRLRRRAAAGRRPVRAPYDWASDPEYRQAVIVRRRAS